MLLGLYPPAQERLRTLREAHRFMKRNLTQAPLLKATSASPVTRALAPAPAVRLSNALGGTLFALLLSVAMVLIGNALFGGNPLVAQGEAA